MSDDGTFTWKARVRGCQCCKWKDERIDELEADRERLRGESIDMGKYVWVETETWDSVMHKVQGHE